MTEQERFEADYLAAFPKSELILESRDEEGRPTSPFVHYAEQVWLQQNKRHEAEIAELRAKVEARRGAEEAQWRNIRKVVNALADLCFGSKDDPMYGSCHIAITTSLTAKDGLGLIELEPLYTAPPAQAVSVPEGWKLVPVEPTREQLIAAHTRYWSGLASANISDYWEEVSKPLWQATWSAMLAAAPEPKS